MQYVEVGDPCYTTQAEVMAARRTLYLYLATGSQEGKEVEDQIRTELYDGDEDAIVTTTWRQRPMPLGGTVSSRSSSLDSH